MYNRQLHCLEINEICTENQFGFPKAHYLYGLINSNG